MPKLKPATQAQRRDRILDAAERCFAEAGFHRTTMLDICKAAGVSSGALYVYFASKEALIEGLCERDRTDFAERFARLAAAPDFLEALRSIGEHYFVEELPHKRLFCIEMGIESTRNPRVAAIFRSVDKFCADSFQALFQRLKDEGRIAPSLKIPDLSSVFHVIGEGMFWRRAVHPDFDAKAVLPALLTVLTYMLNPVPEASHLARPAPASRQPTELLS